MDDLTQTPLIDRAFNSAGQVPEGVTAETDAPAAPAETQPSETKAPAEATADKAQPQADAKEPIKEAAPSDKQGEVKADTKPEFNWDSEDNPFKKRVDDLSRREKAARDWATQINQQYVAQQRELSLINKKLDGTYDPAMDDPRQPDAHQVLAHGQIAGKVQASEVAAREKYGDKFEPEIQRFHELFESNPLIQSRVLEAKAPMLEAMQVLKEFDITQKYGSTDVDVIMQKIRAETENELREKITKEVTQKFMDGIANKNKNPEGLRGVRPAGGDTPKSAGPKPLSAFFNNN